MTIALATSGTNGDGTGPLGGTLNVTVAIAAGRTALMGFVSSGAANPTVSTITNGGAWSLIGALNNGIIRAELWGTAVNASLLASSVNIGYSGTGDFVIGSVVVYTGVAAYGINKTGTGSAAANPSISTAIQDPNNWIAAVLGTSFGSDPTALTGNLRTHWGQASSGGSGKQGDLGIVDNTSASVGSVVTAETQSSTTVWAGVAVELRSVIGSPYRSLPISRRSVPLDPLFRAQQNAKTYTQVAPVISAPPATQVVPWHLWPNPTSRRRRRERV